MKVELAITDWPAHKAAVERVLDGACELVAKYSHCEAYSFRHAEDDKLRLAINAVCRAYGLPDRFAVQEGKG